MSVPYTVHIRFCLNTVSSGRFHACFLVARDSPVLVCLKKWEVHSLCSEEAAL